MYGRDCARRRIGVGIQNGTCCCTRPSQRIGRAVNSVESPRAATGLSPELAGTVRTIFSEHDINSDLLLQHVRAALQCFSWTCSRVVGYLYVHWPRDTSIAFSHLLHDASLLMPSQEDEPLI